MPIYEFVCLECGHDFEKLRSFSDTSTPACPNCQSIQVQRRLSPPAIHFKGSGWYVTDSKNGAKSNKATPNGGDKSEVKASEGGSEASSDKSEAKPSETKSEGKGETKKESTGSAVKEAA
jgi:putative FmdB family regulatory protein